MFLVLKDEFYVINGFTFKRVDKKMAERIFDNDLVLILLPSNMSMNINYMGLHIWRKRFSDFDSTVADFQRRNCDASRGRTVKYFIPIIKHQDGSEKYDYNYHNLV